MSFCRSGEAGLHEASAAPGARAAAAPRKRRREQLARPRPRVEQLRLRPPRPRPLRRAPLARGAERVRLACQAGYDGAFVGSRDGVPGCWQLSEESAESEESEEGGWWVGRVAGVLRGARHGGRAGRRVRLPRRQAQVAGKSNLIARLPPWPGRVLSIVSATAWIERECRGGSPSIQRVESRIE